MVDPTRRGLLAGGAALMAADAAAADTAYDFVLPSHTWWPGTVAACAASRR